MLLARVFGVRHGGKFLLGIGEELIVAAGDHLLIAQPQYKERRAGKVTRPGR
jgi:hypothetical protein